ncbi:ring-cleaving dioxygenase [Flavisolibacter tropicus]|uniref:Diguanylate cyclase n=1 Tax=Flavisolibacter tropicus TaxID=1492898 RepID=A0A172TWS9_9BACT|nr:ring-cleaving dioxygenase [Flavisolibacter tropicus]ANE51545.1 diguanylate cyclase [Flavisolibacter tropicus]
MENKILGLHHITAIAGDAQRNYDFYTRVLGVRLVKKTVNFDDPGTYHFYFGDEVGTPGSILTFFPWEGIQKGSPGTGMATEIGYAVPKDSLPFWKNRFETLKVKHQPINERFGEQYLSFEDPDGLQLNLVATNDTRKPWVTNEVKEDTATKGFHSIVLTVRNSAATAKVLTDIFGYRLLTQEGNRYRFITEAIDTANVVDIVEDPNGQRGINAGGTNHHVAFRVKDENILMNFREKVVNAGLNITEKIDRNYFYSLYFREPGGVLFEIATDNPGFATDESISELGTHLMLPPQYEPARQRIVDALPALKP